MYTLNSCNNIKARYTYTCMYTSQILPSNAESLRGVSCLGGGGVTIGGVSADDDLLFLLGTVYRSSVGVVCSGGGAI